MNDHKKTKAKNTLLPVLLVAAGLGVSIAFLYLFAELAEEMLESEVESFDNSIIGFFHHFATDTLDVIMFWITESGSIWFLSIFSLLFLSFLWLKKRDKWSILFFIIAIGGGGLLTKLLKLYFGRERPSIDEAIDAIGYSFPSGHSMGSLLFYGFLGYYLLRSNLKKRIKWIAFYLCGLMPILIGMSRIYLGAHYPSDVIAGYLAGGIWLILCILALEYVKWRSASQRKPIRAFKEFIGRQLDHKL
ncbi:phosphatase PAP2 family protein [Bacillus sp. ISL-35]|uniref:phosphatase PAP2 family protein n=1 Tax=Bacillus sp. ISL-35 TaxID=2819122 RepID=UPI001BE8DD1E|nr:phosphatase PAP2 family protein [Bacillus sp. ISL-35]MBT2681735.1 phosphatase PAP2 family protein [Bacillus sp. ISL-35]MBT2706032.1 phosphatase PAP2 family protein [Chryseobacterium sp. ISL-80]